MIMRSRTLVLTLALTVLLSLSSYPVHAAPAVLGLTITPPSFDVTASPGDVVAETLKLRNQSSDTTTYEPVIERFTVEGSEGVTQLHQDSQDEPGNIASWFSFADKTLTLNPQEVKTTGFSLNVPKDAAPGSYFASVIFQAKSVSSAQSTGAQVVQRVAALLILTVRGAVTEKAQIESMSARYYGGEWDEVAASDPNLKAFVARNDNYKPDQVGKYFNNGPLAFDVFVQNQGNVNLRPVGSVGIYNMFGQKVDDLILDGKNIFPQRDRRLTIIWPTKNLWGGFYSAKFVAVYGSGNLPLFAEVRFFAFPWLPALITLVVATMIFLGRRRFALAFRVLTKGR